MFHSLHIKQDLCFLSFHIPNYSCVGSKLCKFGKQFAVRFLHSTAKKIKGNRMIDSKWIYLCTWLISLETYREELVMFKHEYHVIKSY